MTERMQLSLTEVAALVDGRLVDGQQAGSNGAHGTVTGVSSDSRTLRPGELFVALRGPRFDGHHHLADALAAGAAGALVAETGDTPLAQVLVDDTRLALGRLARGWRRRCATPTVAVTGSNGKTTVKEMVAAILATAGPTLATRGNLNNDIGVPLTLLRLTPAHRYAVVEMGANHPGEIAYLTALAEPNVALVNNAGPAHLEGFGDIPGVARAKGEIYSGLGPTGTAVFNGDDPQAEVWSALTAGHRAVRFGIDRHGLEVRAEQIGNDAGHGGQRFDLVTPSGGASVELSLPGRHNLYNALAAAAAAHALGLPAASIAAGLKQVVPVAGRLNFSRGHAGAALMDDTYNANPASLEAALAVLQQRPGRHILVLGDLAELGPDAEAIHRRIGRDARRYGVDALYASGPLSGLSALAFGDCGHRFDDLPALVAAVRGQMDSGVSVLVKGSRSAAMERVTAALGSSSDRASDQEG